MLFGEVGKYSLNTNTNVKETSTSEQLKENKKKGSKNGNVIKLETIQMYEECKYEQG